MKFEVLSDGRAGGTLAPNHERDALLHALAVPALLVTANGLIERANRRAYRLAAQPLEGSNLHDFFPDQTRPLLSTFLARCSGCQDALVGAIYLPEKSGGFRKFRCYGSLLTLEPTIIFLRLDNSHESNFGLLNERIAALNKEIADHYHTQAVLRETLADRELLLREIHHRVKNNIQVLQGMLWDAADNAHHPAAKMALQEASRRLMSMAVVQQVLYGPGSPTSYRADEFLRALIPQLQATWPSSLDIKYSAQPIVLSSTIATPLALITNELVTNAVKHGLTDGRGQISVELKQAEDMFELAVLDPGPGFDPARITSGTSGLRLVRGLVRQLGGSFTVETAQGNRCRVRFPHSPEKG